MDNYYYLKISKSSDLEDKKERTLYRFFEILPGALAWSTLGAVIFLSFKLPAVVAIFIILFDVYWLVKTIYMAVYFKAAFGQMKENMKINWLQKLAELDSGPAKPWDEELKPIVTSWRDIFHVIIFPTFKETGNVVEATIGGLIKANYPKDRMVVIIAQEERAGREHNEQVKKYISENFEGAFLKLAFSEHPEGIRGELAGKGANAAWAGRYAKREIIDKLGIDYRKVMISNFDIDTVIFPEYFGRLTHAFLTAKNPLRASYQPVPLYTNNIWEAPSFARIVAFSSSFWYSILQEKFEHSTTFSSHSMPFKALVDVDFWQTNIVSEDSRIFAQCLLRYNGKYRIQPLYYPVSMDANVAPGFWATMKNVYKQQRRWAWGAESIPYYLFGFYKNKAVPLTKKLIFSLVRIEDFWSWATNALIIFMLGWLPVIVGGSDFNKTVLSFNLPKLTRTIMSVAMIGLVTTAIFSITILPPRPPKYGRMKHLGMFLQWLLFPITSILLGALPALDAQTRLMLGKYMGFWITPKIRADQSIIPEDVPK